MTWDINVDANIDLKIDGLNIPAFTWAWFGINIAEGMIAGIGGLIFDQLASSLFGGQSHDERFSAMLRKFGRMLAEAHTQSAVSEAEALLLATKRNMSEFMNAPGRTDRLEFATNDSVKLIARLEQFGARTYPSYMEAASLRLAILQERFKRDPLELANFEEARQRYIAHHLRIEQHLETEIREAMSLKRATEYYKIKDLWLASIGVKNLGLVHPISSRMGPYEITVDGTPILTSRLNPSSKLFESDVATVVKKAKEQYITPGNIMVKRWRQIFDVGALGERFRKVNDYARNNGYIGGYPNFHQADYGQGVVYGAILIKPEAANIADIPVSELGNPDSVEARFRAVNDYTRNNGYIGGYPNFHQADYGQGVVYGAILIKPEAANIADIPVSELGNPDSVEARFRAVNDYARNNGYIGGYPNFHQADHGQGVVYGAILIKPEAANIADLSISSLKAMYR